MTAVLINLGGMDAKFNRTWLSQAKQDHSQTFSEDLYKRSRDEIRLGCAHGLNCREHGSGMVTRRD